MKGAALVTMLPTRCVYNTVFTLQHMELFLNLKTHHYVCW